ncbi:hypothetical protein F4779DRAFT_601778 [Xylariaceae sp. FL0662B]|nr:hypothetical protein F4779DRAFT_601778 [Xylariaceae sp. FL0662B]
MTFRIFSDSQQGAGFVLCVVTIPLCTVAIILRLASTRHARRKIGSEDIFALIALVFHLLFTTIFIYLLTQLNGQNYAQIAAIAPDKLTHILKVGWIMSAQYCGNQLFSKLSLLVLYHRLFSVNRTFNRWLYFLAILQICWFISTYLVKYFLCVPAESAWNLSIPGRCINIGAFLAATESVNALIDFAMIALAIWIVQSLHMEMAMKWKLAILFSVGGFSGVIGFIKIAEVYSAAYNNLLSPIWDIVQMATSIICCCAPIYRSLLPDLGIIKMLGSKLGSYARSLSKNKTQESDTNGMVWAESNSGMSTGELGWLPLDEQSQRGSDRLGR